MNFEHDFSGDDDLKQAYSYDRPSWMVMNALMNGFMANGLTEEQARVLFSSKAIRHALDQSFGEALEAMAYHFGITISNQYKNEPWLNEELV
jgi:hypothetical protein